MVPGLCAHKNGFEIGGFRHDGHFIIAAVAAVHFPGCAAAAEVEDIRGIAIFREPFGVADACLMVIPQFMGKDHKRKFAFSFRDIRHPVDLFITVPAPLFFCSIAHFVITFLPEGCEGKGQTE